MYRVLVVDDSEAMRLLMRRALESAGDLAVAALAGDGEEALAQVKRHRPDVVTMDILMPVMGGLEATRRIMEQCPVPIVMVSAIGDSEEQRISFEAMEAGAVWVVKKPRGAATADWNGWSQNLGAVVRSMAQVKVVSRRPGRTGAKAPAVVPAIASAPLQAIAMAASTGGPSALRTVLTGLPAEFPVPILVCQHIARGFVAGLTEWLAADVEVPVRIARGVEALRPGVTFAPDTGHLLVSGENETKVIPDKGGIRYVPSADLLFESTAGIFKDRAAAIIMTGMGRDGAEGMKAMRDAGALTIAQDEGSSLIYGMPRVASETGAAQIQMDLEQIALTLRGLGPGRAGQDRRGKT